MCIHLKKQDTLSRRFYCKHGANLMYLSSYSIMVEKEIEIESPDEFQARGFVEVLEMAV